MIVPASGHQVRCIPWVQMGAFNKEIGFLCGLKFFAFNIFCEEYLHTYNRVYIWCCKCGENRYCERCANKSWCASKHTGLFNWCLEKWYLYPYLVVPLISARVPLISTRVSAHCQAILLVITDSGNGLLPVQCQTIPWHNADMFQVNACEITVCQISAVLPKLEYITNQCNIFNSCI